MFRYMILGYSEEMWGEKLGNQTNPDWWWAFGAKRLTQKIKSPSSTPSSSRAITSSTVKISQKIKKIALGSSYPTTMTGPPTSTIADSSTSKVFFINADFI